MTTESANPAHEFRIIGCGGRGYGDVADDLTGEFRRKRIINAARERDHLFASLYAIHADRKITSVMTGGATGADHWINQWAVSNGIPALVEKADWVKHGRSAGPIRNAAMLRLHQPHAVVAAPGNAGTLDMKSRARAANVEVIEIGPPI